MKYAERKNSILKLLDEYGSLTVQQMTELLQISEATARRDIIKLVSEGSAQRSWGGIRNPATPENIRKERLKSTHEPDRYTAIGRYAAAQVRSNELIFIGAGTTTLPMIPYINGKNILVITNGIPQLERLHKARIPALLLCGFYKEYSRSLVGKETIELLRNYQFDRAFFGANGLDESLNILSADEYEDEIKALCIQNSRESYLLAGEDKFHRTAAFYKILNRDAARVHLIVDGPAGMDPAWWTETDGICTTRIKDLRYKMIDNQSKMKKSGDKMIN